MPKKAVDANASTNPPTETAPAERVRVSQADIPAYSLEDALRVPRAIADNYNLKPTTSLNVAAAMKVSPSTGPFRMITGSCGRLWPNYWWWAISADRAHAACRSDTKT